MTGFSPRIPDGPIPAELAVRLAAFQYLGHLTRLHGEALPYHALIQGFTLDGRRVPLMGPQGIFKPQILEFPLSITTAAPSPRRPRPYDDGVEDSGLVRYRYRGEDLYHRDNVGLREAMQRRLPLVYFHGLVKAKYQAIWPVVIVADDPGSLSFLVSPEDNVHVLGCLDTGELPPSDPGDELRRRYAAREVKQRLHQEAFRIRVLHAYRDRCTICSLRHPELLDAAHIIADSQDHGEPRVPNGLSMCKLHHAAFDRNIMGISPDYVVEIRQDILDEVDGPMLRHGLQDVHGQALQLPSRRIWYPDKDLVDERYQAFKSAV